MENSNWNVRLVAECVRMSHRVLNDQMHFGEAAFSFHLIKVALSSNFIIAAFYLELCWPEPRSIQQLSCLYRQIRSQFRGAKYAYRHIYNLV